MADIAKALELVLPARLWRDDLIKWIL